MVEFNELISSDMHPTEVKVLHEIYTMLSAHKKCFFSLKYIAKRIGVSARTVQRNLDKLLMRGLITKDHRFTPSGRQQSNLYYITEKVNERAENIKRNIKQKRQDRKKKSRQLKTQINEIKNAVRKRIQSGMSPASQISLDTLPDPHKYDKESEMQKIMFRRAKERIRQLKLEYN
jgi:DNA-binding MarR family transcriptional regulator